MTNFLLKIFNFFYRRFISAKYNVKLGRNVYINRNTVFEGSNHLGNNCIIANSYLGFASYISDNSQIRRCKIGRYSSLGPDIKCVFGKHPVDLFVSTHPAFFSTLKQVGFTYTQEQLFEEYENPADQKGGYQIVIGNDVWIGAGVTIMDGVTIGDGAIIAANALVNKDVEPYSIMGGLPAKKIKSRFDKETVAFLLDFKWWNKEKIWIENNAFHFKNISSFKQHFIKSEQEGKN